VRVVGARDDPLLARDELGRAHGKVRGLEAADEGAVARVPDADGAVVEVGEEPGGCACVRACVCVAGGWEWGGGGRGRGRGDE